MLVWKQVGEVRTATNYTPPRAANGAIIVPPTHPDGLTFGPVGSGKPVFALVDVPGFEPRQLGSQRGRFAGTPGRPKLKRR